jgi:hypothetical protein
MDWNRDSVASGIVGMGGAWMIGSAFLTPGAARLNFIQRRGLVLTGAGFLVNAIAARWLQAYGRAGIACSLTGSALAMVGMNHLLRERTARRAAAPNADSRE